MATLDKNGALEALHLAFAQMNASDVADLWLSPFASKNLLNESTRESGPSLWIVNRSDVYDETLVTLAQHPLPEIAARAKEKYSKRHTTLTLLEQPPELEGPIDEVPDYMIEDVLGHPLVPFEATLYFSNHLLEDYRASAALSLTRRILEHAPNWNADLGLKNRLIDVFGSRLLSDSSPFVRAYCARIPILPSSLLTQAWDGESHPLVLGRLLQSLSTPTQVVEQACEEFLSSEARSYRVAHPVVQRVLSFDTRVNREFRSALASNERCDPVARAAHHWLS